MLTVKDASVTGAVYPIPLRLLAPFRLHQAYYEILVVDLAFVPLVGKKGAVLYEELRLDGGSLGDGGPDFGVWGKYQEELPRIIDTNPGING